MNPLRLGIILFSLAAVLSACGGGGGGVRNITSNDSIPDYLQYDGF